MTVFKKHAEYGSSQFNSRFQCRFDQLCV